MTNALTTNRIDAALAVLRAGVGTVFVAHGAQKVFVYGLAGTAGAFGQMGIPGAEFAGPLVAFVELFGGIAIALGLLTRLASLGTAAVMLGAMGLVHAKAGFFLPAGIEFTLVLFAASVAVALAGAGRYSVDALIPARRKVAAPVVTPPANLRRAA